MRELRENFRLVMTGISAGPSKMWSESQVEDDGLTEPAKKTKFKGTDFSKSLGDVWVDSILAVKEEEDLTEE